MKTKDEKEWMEQAEYDLRAAEKMFETGIFPYCVFMCHLSIEKALKAAYYFKLKSEPPKIHDLSKLCALSNLSPPQDIQDSIDKLSTVSVTARYPEEIRHALKGYTKISTKATLKNTRMVIAWLKEQLNLA